MENQQSFLQKLCSVDIGGSVLPILTQFLSNRSQSEETGERCVRSAAGQCLGPAIVHPVHFGAFYIVENKLIGLCRGLHFDGCCAIPRR